MKKKIGKLQGMKCFYFFLSTTIDSCLLRWNIFYSDEHR